MDNLNYRAIEKASAKIDCPGSVGRRELCLDREGESSMRVPLGEPRISHAEFSHYLDLGGVAERLSHKCVSAKG